MINDTIEIRNIILGLIGELFPLTGEDAEFEILNFISDELLKEMGQIEHYNDVKKALINMFYVGRTFPIPIDKIKK